VGVLARALVLRASAWRSPHLASQSETRLATLERWLGAYNAHDDDALVALADPSIEVRPSKHLVPLGTSFHGHEGVRTWVKLAVERFPASRAERREVRELGAWLMALLTIVKDPDSDEPDEDIAALYDIGAGKVRRVFTFSNEADALAAATGGTEGRRLLTAREREIFQLLAQGLNSPQIADKLFLSPATVRTHVQNAVTRLDASTRVQAIAIAMARGEITLEPGDQS
jgi:DNA-binding CsgD family transcriptional regulator